ncbi:cupin domain-containing protein (plasmid) [Agrobacterium vitis]|uniref:cupin domain-containing protein n=1 Tax=Agrobacterium vitis TaxID=373 RepID=UPI0012E89558|nr:cupin domain-containing protein [Agrobacterium vitis]MVA27286.1 cupin domain-containing protein [Agrobacterium vitis]
MNVEKVIFQQSEWVPNNQRLPVLIYQAALTEAGSSGFEAAFSGNGWTGIWRDGVFDYHHYHTGAHEVLGVGSGSATLLLGGPDGREFKVSKGDCLILPAGTGHRNLGSSPDFQVVGAYPKDQHADIQTLAATAEMQEKISSLPVPDMDALYGSTGGLVEIWR